MASGMNPLLNQFQDQIEVLVKQYHQAGSSVGEIVMALEMTKLTVMSINKNVDGEIQSKLESLAADYYRGGLGIAGLSKADIVLTLEMAKTSLVLDEVALREAHHGSNN